MNSSSLAPSGSGARLRRLWEGFIACPLPLHLSSSLFFKIGSTTTAQRPVEDREELHCHRNPRPMQRRQRWEISADCHWACQRHRFRSKRWAVIVHWGTWTTLSFPLTLKGKTWLDLRSVLCSPPFFHSTQSMRSRNEILLMSPCQQATVLFSSCGAVLRAFEKVCLCIRGFQKWN